MWWLPSLLLVGWARAYTVVVPVVDWTYINSQFPDHHYNPLSGDELIGKWYTTYYDMIIEYNYSYLPTGGGTVTAAWVTVLNGAYNHTDKNITVAPVGVRLGPRSTVSWNYRSTDTPMGPDAEAQFDLAESTILTVSNDTWVLLNVSIAAINRWISGVYREEESMALVFMDKVGNAELAIFWAGIYCNLYIEYVNATTTTTASELTATLPTIATQSTTATTTTESPTASSSLAGIIGGAVGGVAALAIGTTAAVVYYRRASARPVYTKLNKNPARTPHKKHHNSHNHHTILKI